MTEPYRLEAALTRRARRLLPNTPRHLIQRGNNRRVCFADSDDCLACLTRSSERQAGYRELFRQHLAEDLVDEIRQITNNGLVLGRPRFQQQAAGSAYRTWLARAKAQAAGGR